MAEYLKGKKAIVVGLPGGACCVCGTPVLGLCGPGMRGELTPPSPSPRDDAHDARAHPAFTCVPSGLEGGCGRTKRRRGCSRTPHAQHTRQAHLIVRARPRVSASRADARSHGGARACPSVGRVASRCRSCTRPTDWRRGSRRTRAARATSSRRPRGSSRTRATSRAPSSPASPTPAAARSRPCTIPHSAQSPTATPAAPYCRLRRPSARHARGCRGAKRPRSPRHAPR